MTCTNIEFRNISTHRWWKTRNWNEVLIKIQFLYLYDLTPEHKNLQNIVLKLEAWNVRKRINKGRAWSSPHIFWRFEGSSAIQSLAICEIEEKMKGFVVFVFVLFCLSLSPETEARSVSVCKKIGLLPLPSSRVTALYSFTTLLVYI